MLNHRKDKALSTKVERFASLEGEVVGNMDDGNVYMEVKTFFVHHIGFLEIFRLKIQPKFFLVEEPLFFSFGCMQ